MKSKKSFINRLFRNKPCEFYSFLLRQHDCPLHKYVHDKHRQTLNMGTRESGAHTEKKLSKNVKNHHVMYTVTTMGNRTALHTPTAL